MQGDASMDALTDTEKLDNLIEKLRTYQETWGALNDERVRAAASGAEDPDLDVANVQEMNEATAERNEHLKEALKLLDEMRKSHDKLYEGIVKVQEKEKEMRDNYLMPHVSPASTSTNIEDVYAELEKYRNLNEQLREGEEQYQNLITAKKDMLSSGKVETAALDQINGLIAIQEERLKKLSGMTEAYERNLDILNDTLGENAKRYKDATKGIEDAYAKIAALEKKDTLSALDPTERLAVIQGEAEKVTAEIAAITSQAEALKVAREALAAGGISPFTDLSANVLDASITTTREQELAAVERLLELKKLEADTNKELERSGRTVTKGYEDMTGAVNNLREALLEFLTTADEFSFGDSLAGQVDMLILKGRTWSTHPSGSRRPCSGCLARANPI
jgi:chromosome segregation ATPase